MKRRLTLHSSEYSLMLADVYIFTFSFERLELRSMLILVLVDISIIDHEHMHVDYHNYDNFDMDYASSFVLRNL